MLNSEPWLFSGVGIEDFLGEMSEVGVGWHKIFVGVVGPGVSLGENHDVVSSSEWVWEEEDWLENNLRVLGATICFQMPPHWISFNDAELGGI